ncbi:MAG: phosphatidylserine decarboxylase family protein [Nitrospirae bacterium]|nr:phosphatidylserine decarboxylase family protein [Candidatus Troglogloeales bacterium]
MGSETQFPIANDGFRFIAIGIVLTWIAKASFGVEAAIFFGLLTLFCVWFFRDPRRSVPKGDRLIVSPADGTIVDIAKFYEEQFIEGPALKVSIFLNIFDVHITRIPVEGEVVSVLYNAGRFFAANVPKASLENEQNKIFLKTPWGNKVIVIQIAGLIARRIVCWTKTGAKMKTGERFGLIRFGSRVDLIVPAGTGIRVSVGDKVVGGETILGKFR